MAPQTSCVERELSRSSSSSPIAVALACVTLLGLAAACTRDSTHDAAKPAPITLKKGASLFHFDYETVTDLLIVKADPATGDRWSARLQRPDTRSVDWEIRTDRAGQELRDRKADGYFILHLLDTLRTLQVTEDAVSGSDESLGLASPRFALQWRASAPGAPSSSEFELRIGAPAPRQPGSVFAQLPGKPAFSMNGAALQMLGYVQDFDSLRLKTWAGIVSDDVDEIEVLSGGKSVFYAQREGSDWNDRKHRPVRGDISAWLDRVTHQRVQRFIDDPKEAEKLRTAVSARPVREVVLKGRENREARLQLGRVGGRTIALSSARPQGVFEAYPAAIQALARP